MSRIRLVPKTIKRGPLVLLLGGERDIVAALTAHFRARSCRIFHTATLTKLTRPYDYIILLNEIDLLLPALLLAKKSRARLACVFSSEKNLPSSVSRQIATYRSQGVDVRLRELDFREQTPELVRMIEATLLGSGSQERLVLPTPPPPIPTPPPPILLEQISPEKRINSVSKFSRPALFTVLIFIVVFFLLLPVVQALRLFQEATNDIRDLEVAASSGQLTSAQIARVQERLTELDAQLMSAKRVVEFLGFRPIREDLEVALDLTKSLSAAARHSANLARLGQDASSQIFAHRNLPLTQTIERVTSELNELEKSLVDSSTTLDSLSQSEILKLPLITPWLKEVRGLQSRLGDALVLTKLTKSIVPYLPRLVGAEGKRVYLLILQNNMELRPTGGFIGSYGLATFDQGKLVELKIEDVYAADGQLRGHVDPPPPLRKYLSLEHWYLRDANFDPNFPFSAQQIEWFLQKEIGRSVDGVIALDLTFAKRVLDALGGLDLPDYKERITSDNFFLQAQVAAEDNFFPGSTQKRDFLGHFAHSLVRELQQERKMSWISLGHALKTSLDEKHILVSVHDKAMQSVFETAGWSGRLLPVACTQNATPCRADYFTLVDTNVGVNKANYYLRRAFNNLVSIGNQDIERTTTITYHNDSPSDVFPTGDYRNYARIYLPRDAGNITVLIDEERLLDSEYTLLSLDDKIVLGFYLEVPVGSSRQVKVAYKLFPRDDTLPPAYQLIVQKQPGTERDPLSLQLDLAERSLVQSNFPLPERPLVNSRAITYNSDLSLDRVFSILMK